jgi:hypothetical protein
MSELKLRPPERNLGDSFESLSPFILNFEIEERFLHSGTAKDAVPPDEMTAGGVQYG